MKTIIFILILVVALPFLLKFLAKILRNRRIKKKELEKLIYIPSTDEQEIHLVCKIVKFEKEPKE